MPYAPAFVVKAREAIAEDAKDRITKALEIMEPEGYHRVMVSGNYFCSISVVPGPTLGPLWGTNGPPKTG